LTTYKRNMLGTNYRPNQRETYKLQWEKAIE
jgi:hypothetical protein